jgi:hypothetical protein
MPHVPKRANPKEEGSHPGRKEAALTLTKRQRRSIRQLRDALAGFRHDHDIHVDAVRRVTRYRIVHHAAHRQDAADTKANETRIRGELADEAREQRAERRKQSRLADKLDTALVHQRALNRRALTNDRKNKKGT